MLLALVQSFLDSWACAHSQCVASKFHQNHPQEKKLKRIENRKVALKKTLVLRGSHSYGSQFGLAKKNIEPIQGFENFIYLAAVSLST